ncbi:MAG: NAD(P)/FAD-dependent oxidoreductase [Acidimicrobiia bacterium]|nr:NAD(P)/FAD-dependent oxidoreductase [Acidimicrobiia bacterium]
MFDAVIVGSGPNGLVAAVTLAEAGKRVLVLEASATIGGGARTAELTLPGVRHDVCSSVHPLGAGSPVMAALHLTDLAWAHPEIAMAHPLDDGSAALLLRDPTETATRLGDDAAAYRATFGSVARHWEHSVGFALGPPLAALRHPLAGARFGRLALQPASWLARRFRTPQGRALVGGLAGHAAVPLTRIATAGVGLTLGAAGHAVGWPFAAGGSGAIVDALARRLRSLGGEIRTRSEVIEWSDLPETHVVMFDTLPSTAARIAGDRIPGRVARRYRSLRPGPGVFKVDVALSGPIPWTNADCRRAGTIHVGGTYEEIARAEAMVAAGEHPEHPFIIASQPVVADPVRAPAGTHVLWAYCHVPSGSDRDMTDPIFAQIERFAPGFGDLVVAVNRRNTADLAADNANQTGGDITGGELSLRGLLARPKVLRPYRAAKTIFLCSASTPPGAGVHGMCGHHAARAALRAL